MIYGKVGNANARLSAFSAWCMPLYDLFTRKQEEHRCTNHEKANNALHGHCSCISQEARNALYVHRSKKAKNAYRAHSN